MIKESVAEFVSSHRLGERKKMSFLVLDNGNKVVANLFLPWTRLGDIKDIREAARVLAGYVHQCGGARGVLYGNYEYTPDDGTRLRNLSARMKELEAPFLDALHVEHSARDYGLLREPGGGEEEAGAEIRKVDATASIRKGEIRKLAKEISEDRGDKSSGRLVVILSKSSPDERKALKEAISQESNGTLADLAKRAKDISELAAEHIEVKPVSFEDFEQLIHDNKDEVTIIDDGMRVRFGSNSTSKIYNHLFSELGAANKIVQLMGNAKYAYSQPHNNTGEQRGNGSVHPDRENALEYRNYVNKFSNGEGTFYLRFVVMRMTDGNNRSHGAMISEVNISKENATSINTDDVLQGELPGTSLPKRTAVSGYTLKPDTKLQNFFEIASKGREIFDGKIYKIPLKGEDVVVYGVEKEGGDVPEAPASYRIVDDPELLNELEDGEWEEAYRVMQVIDGELYPPMAAVREGDLVPPIKLGLIEQAEEHPELIIFDEEGKPQYLLNKGQGKGSLKAAYNPYWHTSRTALNDQFTSAHVRPNLVVVRALVPKSELTSGYKAQYAKDAVGEMSWHSGSVSGQLAKLGRPRRVILSRYDKPMEIVPHAEAARMIAEQLRGTDIAIPYNLVWPQLREELEKLGVEISDEASGSVGEDASFGKAEYITDKMIAEMNDKAKRGMPQTPEAKRTEAERLAKKFNTPINIIGDVNEITHPNAEVQERRRRSKGWYDTKTGQVNIVLPNNRNVEDVAATVFHETVGHKGLRELIGEEGYSDFLREVFEHAKAEVRRRISKLASKHNWDFEKATDEYLAGLAEKGFEDFDGAERRLWRWLKEKVLKAIDKFLGSLKLPKWVKLGDNELRYMLWRSKERLERGKEHPIDAARDIVKREELGLADAARYNMGKKTTTSERNGAVSGNSSAGGLPQGGSAHLSRWSLTSQTPLDAAKLRHNTDMTKRAARKIQNEGGLRGNLSTASNAIRILSKELHLTRSKSSQSYYGDFYEGDFEVNGKTARVRVSTHPANGERIGNAPADDKISIVIHKNGEHVSTGPHDGYTEYVYEPSEISPAEAANAIVKGVESLIVNGEYADETGKAHRQDYPYQEDGVDLYRDPDETEDILADVSLGLDERVTAIASRLASRNRDDVTLRDDAYRAIGGNLTKLRQAMSLHFWGSNNAAVAAKTSIAPSFGYSYLMDS